MYYCIRLLFQSMGRRSLAKSLALELRARGLISQNTKRRHQLKNKNETEDSEQDVGEF
jgi:hypothetical protein